MVKEGYKQSELGVIPKNWDVCVLGDAAEFLDGKRRPIKDSERARIRGEIPYYGASGIVDYVNNYLFNEDLILLGEDGENILSRNCRLAFLISGKSWVNNHAHVLRPKSEFDIRYLTEYLESLDYKQYNTGSAQPKLNKKVCAGIPIAKPPVSEQKAIAQALSDVDATIAELDRLITKKRNIKQGATQQLLTGKKRLPGFSDEWEEKNLGDIVKVIDGDRGANYPSNDELFDTGYCLFLSAKNVTKEGFRFRECTFITKEKYNLLSKGKLIRNDVILTTRGTVGNIAFFDNSVLFDHIRINSGMVILRNESNYLDTTYLYIILKSAIVQNQIDRIVFGSAQPQLTVKGINLFNIPFPPFSEQKAIAQFLTDMDAEIEALRLRFLRPCR